MIHRREIVLAALTVVALVACRGEPWPAPGEPTDLTGRQVLDTRSPADFARGHDPGAINLQWGWDQLNGGVAGYLPPLDTPVGVRAESAARAQDCVEKLSAAGFRDIEVMTGDVGAARLPVLDLDELARRLDADDGLVVIDVRTPREWERGTIEGALLWAQDAAPAHVGVLDPEGEYAVVCASGFRSSQFASLLRARGFSRVHNVIAGMNGWYRREGDR